MDRAVKISKRELNNLVAELFEFSEMFTNTKDFDDLGPTVPIPEIHSIPAETTINPSLNETIRHEHQTEVILPSTSFSQPQTIILTQPEVPVTILPDQMLLFEQQMRQHVQMLTQNYVLTYQHAHIGDLAGSFKNMLVSVLILL